MTRGGRLCCSQPPSQRSLASSKIKWIVLHTKWGRPSDQCAARLTFFFLLTTSAAGFSWLFAGHLAGETFRAPLTHCCALLEEAQHLTCIINLFFQTHLLLFRVDKEAKWVEVRQAPLERGCLNRSCCIHSDSPFHKNLLVCCILFSLHTQWL